MNIKSDEILYKPSPSRTNKNASFLQSLSSYDFSHTFLYLLILDTTESARSLDCRNLMTLES